MARNAKQTGSQLLPNRALPDEGSRAPADREIRVGELMGTATGEEDDDITVPGGWAGTDEDFSTAVSDRIGLPEIDRLSELTGGAISDRNPVIEGENL